MATTRVFLLASSLSRLVARERSKEIIIEGFFPENGSRNVFVQLRGDSADLFLVSDESGERGEAAAIPPTFAQALLAVAVGHVEYSKTSLPVGDADAQILQYCGEGSAATVHVAFLDQALADIFQVPSWFGPEVSANAAYRHRTMAFQGIPQDRDVPLSDRALHDLLDVLQESAGQEWERQLIAPARQAAQVDRPEPALAMDESDGAIAIEDKVIRELARNLRPSSR